MTHPKKDYPESNPLATDEKSPDYLRRLKDIPIKGNNLSLALFICFLEAIETLGWAEHTSDWDLWLKITIDPNQRYKIIFLNGAPSNETLIPLSHGVIQSITGYTNMIPNYTDERAENILKDYKALNHIEVFIEDPNNSGEEAQYIIARIPISIIQTISVND